MEDVLSFPLSFWFVTAICVLYYACVFPFVAIALPYFQSHFGLSKSEAAALNSVIYIMSAPLAPIMGLIIDLVGFNASFVLLECVEKTERPLIYCIFMSTKAANKSGFGQ